MAHFLSLISLSAAEFAIVAGVVFFAGMVRGFSGFALSAMVMASLAVMLSPRELIPVCWFLEFAAGLMMIRGGIKDADKTVSVGLALSSAIGTPIALYFTTILPLSSSQSIALCIIIILAALQLARVRAPVLATKPGLYVSGFTAGLATGFASVGGMVVALYVLAREAPARSMRASLVLFLFISNIISVVYMIFYGLMDQTAVSRGLIFILPCLLGVMLGKAFFVPKLEPYYKPFCLLLLMMLATAGLAKLYLSA